MEPLLLKKKKQPKKPKQTPPEELKRKGIQAIEPPAERPLDDSLFYLKNKAIPVFWHSFNLFYEFIVAFLSIPYYSPRNICTDFHSSRSCYSPLNFCIPSYSSLLFCFSPILKFINNIKLSSPPSSLISRSPLSAFLSVQHYTIPLFLFLNYQFFHRWKG